MEGIHRHGPGAEGDAERARAAREWMLQDQMREATPPHLRPPEKVYRPTREIVADAARVGTVSGATFLIGLLAAVMLLGLFCLPLGLLALVVVLNPSELHDPVTLVFLTSVFVAALLWPAVVRDVVAPMDLTPAGGVLRMLRDDVVGWVTSRSDPRWIDRIRRTGLWLLRLDRALLILRTCTGPILFLVGAFAPGIIDFYLMLTGACVTAWGMWALNHPPAALVAEADMRAMLRTSEARAAGPAVERRASWQWP